jgi:hypothetical protein
MPRVFGRCSPTVLVSIVDLEELAASRMEMGFGQMAPSSVLEITADA